MSHENNERLSPQEDREESGFRPEAEQAQERRLRSAEALGEGIAAYESRFAELGKEAETLTEDGRAEVAAAVGHAQAEVLGSYPESFTARASALETGKADVGLAFDEEALERDRAELTARRIERAAFTIGSSVAALAEAPRAAVEKAVTPFLETSRGALGQAAGAASETIDKLSPSIVKAAEDTVLKLGSAGAQVGGKALLQAAEGLGKLIEKVGFGTWAVTEKIIEKAPAAAVRGIKAMVMAFKKEK